MASNIQQFEALVGQLMSEDNNIRTQSENAFNETKKNPDFCIQSLIHLIKTSQHEQIRALSVVLLRRNLRKASDSLLPLISPQTQEFCKVTLLELLASEQKSDIRNKVADCIGELAVSVIGEENNESGKWDELLPAMFKATQSPVEGHRESALNIFNRLASSISWKLKNHFEMIKGVLIAGLNDPQSLKVRIAALGATSIFLQEFDEKRNEFQALTPLMLGTISAALNANQEDEARSAIQLFVDLAESDPTFLRPHLSSIIQAMMTIATAGQLESSTKQLGVEFLVTLAENKAGMVRKIPKFIESIIPILLNMMLDLEDNDDWALGQEEDEVDITDSDIGEESLDRLSIALGGKTIVPIIFNIIPGFLADQDWKQRHTALMCISIIGEGCSKTITPILGQIVTNVVKYSQDPHPRVRWAACNALGQMSSDFGPDFQEKFHAQTLPTLINVMGDKSNPRVQSHSAAAVINFCEYATPDILEPYLDTLLAKLLALLNEGKIIVQEQVVTAIAAIADCMEERFVKYYDPIMDILKKILNNANSPEYRMLRGKAMECISLIGVAVGKQKFYQDAKEIMEQFMKTQSAPMEQDDPQVSFLLQSWARICRCMGQDFVPYLNYVMPPLLASAKISPDVTITDADNEQSLEGYEFIPIGDKRIGINTSALEEKSTACNMLYCYVSELKEGFFPFVDEVAKLLVPLMKFYYHDGVRQAAVTTMPHLLTSTILYFKNAGAASGADVSYIKNLWNFMLPTFIESLLEEMDSEILCEGLEAFISCVKLLGENSLAIEQIRSIYALVLRLFADVNERRLERAERAKEEDNDEEEAERLEDEIAKDDDIMGMVSELVGTIAKTNKEATQHAFVDIAPKLIEMLQLSTTNIEKQSALCIFDDVMEFLGPLAYPYFNQMFPLAIQYVTHPDPAVRQAAVYGMGFTGQFPDSANYINEVLQRLVAAISQPDSKTVFASPTDNAISSVARILKNNSHQIDAAKVFPLWLSWLPVTSDKVESIQTYSFLCDFLEQSNQFLIGSQAENLPKIVQVLGDILKTELINETITKRIVNIIKGMRASLSPEVMGKVWQTLNDVQRSKLSECLSS